MSNLTPASALREWLADPAAGQILRGMLASQRQSEEALAPALGLPLEQLVKMSGGKFPAELMDVLVTASETGEVPEGLPTAPPAAPTATAPDLGVEIGAPEPWTEQITSGRFAGQTVVVTGAASGIGRAVASRVVREGGRVVAVDVSGDKLADVAAELGEALVPVTADITEPTAADTVLAAAGGRVDALANVAGVMDDDAAVHEVDDKIWQRVMRINVDGPMYLMRAVVPGMLAAGGGRRADREHRVRGGAARFGGRRRVHDVEACARRADEVLGVPVRGYGSSGQRGRAGRRRHGYSGSGRCAVRLRAHREDAGGDPRARDGGGAGRVRHVSAQPGCGEPQRGRSAVGRGLVGGVIARPNVAEVAGRCPGPRCSIAAGA
ncbi:SDR family NAD(P)-dependent oxidoreductase [Streptomyces sp. BH055]|uniref:SDR family NAD(P)-dependent oxidoreductase n=1 Tax=Streptomyces sp. BH055 TaxID=3401173 RepID=UPI003BB61582